MKFATYLTRGDIALAISVDFDYQPFEVATLEDPGCDAEVTINGAVDWLGNAIELTDAEIEQFTDEAFDYMTYLSDREEAMLDERMEAMRKGKL